VQQSPLFNKERKQTDLLQASIQRKRKTHCRPLGGAENKNDVAVVKHQTPHP
jgi:hypothetical protein